jgi:hypothetical protein
VNLESTSIRLNLQPPINHLSNFSVQNFQKVALDIYPKIKSQAAIYFSLDKFSMNGDVILLKSCELGFILDKKEKLLSVEEISVSKSQDQEESSEESEEEQFKIVYEEDEYSPVKE